MMMQIRFLAVGDEFTWYNAMNTYRCEGSVDVVDGVAQFPFSFMEGSERYYARLPFQMGALVKVEVL